MALNLVLIALIALVGLLAGALALRLLRRTPGRARGWARWAGSIALALPALILLAAAAVLARGSVLAYAPRSLPVKEIAVPTDAATVARGEHLALTTCAPCHSPDSTLPLVGGNNLSDDAGLPLGDLYGPNLTAAGAIATWSDGELLRALREGLHQSNRPLLVMPTQRLKNLSDEDAYALIAYLRSQPAVEHAVPPINPSLLSLALAGVGILTLEINEVEGPVVAPPRAPDAAYGAYLVSFKDCRDCHGEALDGVVSPPAPPGPPLFHVEGWTAQQFITTLRTGVNPGGRALQPPMPWQSYGRMDDVELTAVYEYLKTLPAPGEVVASGN